MGTVAALAEPAGRVAGGDNPLSVLFSPRGWQVLLAKGGAVAIYFLIFTLFKCSFRGCFGEGFTAAGSPLSREDLRQLIFSDGSKLYVQYLLVAFSLIAYSQLAFILGQISSRWQGMLSAVSFVAIFTLSANCWLC